MNPPHNDDHLSLPSLHPQPQVFVACGTGFNLVDQLVVSGYVKHADSGALRRLREMVRQQCSDVVFTATTPCEGEMMRELYAASPYDGSMCPVFGEKNFGKVVCAYFWQEGDLQHHFCRNIGRIAERCSFAMYSYPLRPTCIITTKPCSDISLPITFLLLFWYSVAPLPPLTSF